MAVTTVFDPPVPSDSKETFKSKAQDTFAKLNPWAAEVNAVATAVASDAAAAATAKADTIDAAAAAQTTMNGLVSDATAQAGIATQQAGLAAAAAMANATVWIGGATYAQNEIVWADATSAMLYRALQAHSGRTQPPGADQSYWALVGADGAIAAKLAGVTLDDGSPVADGDTVVAAFGKLQRQLVGVRTPNAVSPADGATGIYQAAPWLTGSDYRSIYGSPQLALQVQVNTVNDFTTPAHDSGTVLGASASYHVPTGVVAASTTYYWRIRHQSVDGDWSAWSASASFTTAASIGHYTDTPAATPAAFGDAFEGGFYAGMVWAQIGQSTSSLALATGAITFAVPDQFVAPFVYPGQQVEVRSRANPANNFQGTVTSALGTSLTINVTSISGTGTFADWSVMARHRIIVAPKASGENAGIALKNAATALPTACQNLNDGWRSTNAMRDADTSTVYPAAHWARGLSINGRADWYIPARDELELLWRNLKPVTNNNSTSRAAASSYSYKVEGAYDDKATTNGLNNNSAPSGAAYTTTVPAQTAVAAFQAGGVEAMEFGTAYYWSSTDYDAPYAWGQNWHSSFPGYQLNNNETSAYRVRAVRRSVI